MCGRALCVPPCRCSDRAPYQPRHQSIGVRRKSILLRGSGGWVGGRNVPGPMRGHRWREGSCEGSCEKREEKQGKKVRGKKEEEEREMVRDIPRSRPRSDALPSAPLPAFGLPRLRESPGSPACCPDMGCAQNSGAEPTPNPYRRNADRRRSLLRLPSLEQHKSRSQSGSRASDASLGASYPDRESQSNVRRQSTQKGGNERKKGRKRGEEA